MHHLVIDRWSRGSSSLHQRDPRAKLAALLVFLIVLSTTRPAAQWAFAAYAILLIIAANSARLADSRTGRPRRAGSAVLGHFRTDHLVVGRFHARAGTG